MTKYGPHNPHPLSTMRTELVWEGKYDEFGNRRELASATFSLPLQRIETIDEPRSRAEAQGTLFDEKAAHQDDFRNLLIWGDNRLVLSALRSEFSGKVDLIYIDPPFDIGADFTLPIIVGGDGSSFEKEQSILEEVAYRDIWGRGINSYLSFIYERLVLSKDLLSVRGSLFLHVGPAVSHMVRLLCQEVFGSSCFINEIVWQRSDPHNDAVKKLGVVSDRILWFGASSAPYYDADAQREDLSASAEGEYSLLELPDGSVVNFKGNESKTGRRFKLENTTWKGSNPKKKFAWRGVKPPAKREWIYDYEGMEAALARGELYLRDPNQGSTRCKKMYLDQNKGIYLQDIWLNTGRMKGGSDYPTQKPETLLNRIVDIACPEDGLVMDFFCGSGTTGAVAEMLGRKWVMCDLGRFAIHHSRKRLIDLQRDLYEAGRPYRSFDVYNLGRYERQWWQRESLKGADDEHRRVVLQFFRAEELMQTPSPLLHGRKGTAFVHVDGIDSIFSRGEVVAVAEAAKAAGGREVHCLAWDFEMDIRQVVAAVEAEHGVKLRLHRIPREIMERNRTDVPPFFEVALLEAVPVHRKNGKGQMAADIKLLNFLPALTEVPSKELEALQERAMQSGFDFIDFWAVDFDWNPGQPFNHHWQDYRTRKDRGLKTVSDAEFVYERSGKHTACVKVVDVFGCDTSITVEVEI
ncbi:site-specific DNA-methyltransferase [Mesorhizobium sp.]|uniref:site-specific DNA-methyltransferase n=1 Tax=Mesorhizobium sp. TaxID=1871066 RepID=UPI000FE7410D|nr:site-specific DNA-methyltransferase [Mesorhizobium sp.]RWJ32021.1 MAG: site-specific DNA-methyltransferase [Mesorhizobium sp.]TIQ73772.1 MAG: site-specific DNA-methyltransferase [Mesorhizobium sp.]